MIVCIGFVELCVLFSMAQRTENIGTVDIRSLSL